MPKRIIPERKYKIIRTEPTPPYLERSPIQKLVHRKKPVEKDIGVLIKSIQKMVTEAKNSADVRDGYTKTPEQMVGEGKIKVIYSESNARIGKNPMYGCYQMSSVLFSALKEMGLSPKMTRFFVAGSPHTTVLFRLNGKLYEADPFESIFLHVPKGGKIFTNDTPPFQKVDSYRRKEISDLLSNGKMKFIRPGQYTKQMYDKERKSGKLAV